ncbi:hypothetical protein TcCL_ESM07219 [Trypanosoma cruzi]|nr:hypothetical protein TcCL_ESM07219 [Trypanosoma cruzi]
MIVFCFACLCCRAVCSALCPTSVMLNASQTHSYACALEPWLVFLIIVFLLLFKLLVCGVVCELCNRTDPICLMVCAAAAGVLPFVTGWAASVFLLCIVFCCFHSALTRS